MGAVASSRAINTAFGFIAIALWSTSVALGRNVSTHLGPMTAGGVEYLVGGSVGCLYLAMSGGLREQLKPEHRKYLLGCGALFVGYMVVFYLALARAVDNSQTLEVGLVNYLWPALTLVFLLLVLPLRMRVGFIPGVLAALAGIVLALNHRGTLTWAQTAANLRQHWDPYVLAFIGAVAWALYSALARRWAGTPGKVTGGAVPLFMLASGILMIAARFLFHEHSRPDAKSLIELGCITVAGNVGYVLWDYAMRRGDAVLVAAASYFTPLLSTIFSCLYLGVAAGTRLWLGCLLVLGGAALCKLSVRPRS